LYRALIVAQKTVETDELRSELTGMGIVCTLASEATDLLGRLTSEPVNVLVVNIDSPLSPTTHVESVFRQLHQVKVTLNLPIIAVASEKELQYIDSEPAIDDFILKPWKRAELTFRVKRAVTRSNGSQKEVLKHGGLVIDTARCEVSLDGVVLDLTFREYELLKFLAMNKGRVFTREALLNNVWGYDFYGGERTVDVHIRRLRSKLDDYSKKYIQTVRNIGYRFNDKIGAEKSDAAPCL